MSETYTCARCKGVFEKIRSDAEADLEAEQVWGIPGAHARLDMAIICEECWQAVKPPQEDAEDRHGREIREYFRMKPPQC